MDSKDDTKKSVQWIAADNCYIFECPTCSVPIQVEGNQVNCRIFRHGQLKNTYTIRFSDGTMRMNIRLDNIQCEEGVTLKIGDSVEVKPSTESKLEPGTVVSVHQGTQISPHAPQAICDDLVEKGLIWGCGKPFQLLRGSSGMVEYAVKCGYL